MISGKESSPQSQEQEYQGTKRAPLTDACPYTAATETRRELDAVLASPSSDPSTNRHEILPKGQLTEKMKQQHITQQKRIATYEKNQESAGKGMKKLSDLPILRKGTARKKFDKILQYSTDNILESLVDELCELQMNDDTSTDNSETIELIHKIFDRIDTEHIYFIAKIIVLDVAVAHEFISKTTCSELEIKVYELEKSKQPKQNSDDENVDDEQAEEDPGYEQEFAEDIDDE